MAGIHGEARMLEPRVAHSLEPPVTCLLEPQVTHVLEPLVAGVPELWVAGALAPRVVHLLEQGWSAGRSPGCPTGRSRGRVASRSALVLSNYTAQAPQGSGDQRPSAATLLYPVAPSINCLACLTSRRLAP